MLAMVNIPLSTKPLKARYMWRDLGRRSLMYGASWSSIPPYPLKHLTFANRIALIGTKEDWRADYVRAAYRRWFGKGCDISGEPNLSGRLRDIGQHPQRVLALAASDERKVALTTEARATGMPGIFGAPKIAVGEEIFRGDDQLDDGIVW
jgi:2-hydroxychromene-2-carboxylate isomerase